MACGMKRHARVADLAGLRVADRLQSNVAQAVLDDRGGGLRCQILRVSGSRVVGMAMRDQRARDRAPRINEEISGGAINALGTKFEDHEAQSSRLVRRGQWSAGFWAFLGVRARVG